MATRKPNGVAESNYSDSNDSGEHSTTIAGDEVSDGGQQQEERINGFSTADPRTIHKGGSASANSRGGGRKLTAAQRRKRRSEAGHRAAETRRQRESEAATGANRPAKEKDPNRLKGLETLLLSVHTIGSALVSVPELALDPKEAHVLAEGIENVLQFYDFVPDPKLMAWVNLTSSASLIYGTRMKAYANRLKAERRKRLEASPSPATATASNTTRNEGTLGTPANSAILQSHLSTPPVQEAA